MIESHASRTLSCAITARSTSVNDAFDRYLDHGGPCSELRDHREVDGEQQEDAADTQGLVREETPDSIYIGGAALDQLASLHPVVIAERQALDVIVQVVAQALGHSLGRQRGEPAAHEGETAFQHGEADESEGDERQGGWRALLAQHIVHEVPEKQVRGRLCAGTDGQGGSRAEIAPMITGGHGPEAGQAVGADRVLQIIIVGGLRRRCCHGHRIAPVRCGGGRCWPRRIIVPPQYDTN